MKNIELSIDATYRCFLACPFCSSSVDVLTSDMSFKIARNCLRWGYGFYNSKYQPITITITGGEPLMFNGLPSLISLWSDKPRKNNIILCTTAALDMGVEYWQELNGQGLQGIRLSLHAVSEENCRFIFGEKYSFVTVDRNIELITDAGIPIDANFLVSRISIGNIKEIFKYCHKKGIKKIRILGLSEQGRALKNWDSLSISINECRNAIGQIIELSTQYQINIEFAGLPIHKRCTHSDENDRCLGGRTFFHINTNGDIFPCPSMKSVPAKRIGSVLHSDKVVLRKDTFICLLDRAFC